MIVRFGRRRRRARCNPPGHAEMQQQEAAVVEFDQDVLAAPGQRADARAVEPFGEIGRERPAQIGTPQLGANDPPPGHAQREAAADGFDFGKLGHPGSGRRACGWGYCRAR